MPALVSAIALPTRSIALTRWPPLSAVAALSSLSAVLSALSAASMCGCLSAEAVLIALPPMIAAIAIANTNVVTFQGLRMSLSSFATTLTLLAIGRVVATHPVSYRGRFAPSLVGYARA